MAVLDGNYNGCYEHVWMDLTNNGRVESHLYNWYGSDCFLEILTIDANENGRPEYWAVDETQRDGFERLYVDTNGDGYWDYSEALDSYTIVGGAPTHDGLGGLLLTMARFSGDVAW